MIERSKSIKKMFAEKYDEMENMIKTNKLVY